MSPGDYLNLNEVETGGLQAANFVHSPVSNPIFNIHTTTISKKVKLLICLVILAVVVAVAIVITAYSYTSTTSTESELGK